MLTPADDYPLHQTPEPMALASESGIFTTGSFSMGTRPTDRCFCRGAWRLSAIEYYGCELLPDGWRQAT